ncbi:MAG: hypothetical protein RL235_855 [Chlamydiota bacterium]|jgi:hypothetical protein
MSVAPTPYQRLCAALNNHEPILENGKSVLFGLPKADAGIQLRGLDFSPSATTPPLDQARLAVLEQYDTAQKAGQAVQERLRELQEALALYADRPSVTTAKQTLDLYGFSATQVDAVERLIELAQKVEAALREIANGFTGEPFTDAKKAWDDCLVRLHGVAPLSSLERVYSSYAFALEREHAQWVASKTS